MARPATSASDRSALVADIGGTHARFAIADVDRLTISDFVRLPVADYPTLQAAVRAYLAGVPHRPSIAAFAVAAPVSGERIAMTNSPWSFTRDEIRAAAAVEFILLVNDYEALALSLPRLTSRDLHQIGGSGTVAQATKAVVGPGTGLGVAALAWSSSGWIAIPTEGGHISFAAENGEEFGILEKIKEGREHVSAERLISGPGLVAVYNALRGVGGGSTRTLTAAEITERALKFEDPIAVEVLRYFAIWLGRFAGDAALFFGARGGVYLGGGIPPKILALLMQGAMRKAFESKGRMSDYARQIPTYVIVADDAGLRGAALALSTVLAKP